MDTRTWIEMTSQPLPSTLTQDEFTALWDTYGDNQSFPARTSTLEWIATAGDFDPDNDPTGHARMRQRICAVRAQTIHAETISQPVAPVATAQCSRCGQIVPRSHLMSSASGSVCPDCYDDASF
jgi:hypothetical protein